VEPELGPAPRVELSPELVVEEEKEVAAAEAVVEPLPLDGQNPSTSEDYRPDLHVALLLVETTSSLAVRHLLFHPDHHRNCLYPTPV
jgi:hypothetical protein